MQAPMPEPAPVTIATLSARRIGRLPRLSTLSSTKASRADHVRSQCSIPTDQAVAATPAETILGLAARLVFAADPAGIAEPIERIEHRGKIDLAVVRLGARRHGGDLHVANHREE